jgi:phenylalanyl-tRNA synthetase beta chain
MHSRIRELRETFEFDLGRVAETATIENPMLELIQDGTRYAPLSAYPFVLRDIALWVPAGTAAETVHEIIKQNGGELLIKLDKFDEFSKEGRTSYAFHLVFQSHEKTLSDVEVNEVMGKVSAALTGKGFEIR